MASGAGVGTRGPKAPRLALPSGPRGGLSFCAESQGIVPLLKDSPGGFVCGLLGAEGGQRLGRGFGLCTTFSFSFEPLVVVLFRVLIFGFYCFLMLKIVYRS